MKRRDNGKASLVEFMRSIKFTREKADDQSEQLPAHFAHLSPHVRSDDVGSPEDANLVRSAN